MQSSFDELTEVPWQSIHKDQGNLENEKRKKKVNMPSGNIVWDVTEL